MTQWIKALGTKPDAPSGERMDFSQVLLSPPRATPRPPVPTHAHECTCTRK